MADLARRGFRSVRLEELVDAPRRSVLITFDDAYAHVAAAATPILMEYDFSAVMFAPAAHLGRRNEWDVDQHPRLAALDIATPAQIKSMAGGPWEIASHGWRHIDLCGLQSDERRRELAQARERLSEIAGKPVRALAYPFGLSNEAIRQDALETGYGMAFTASPGPSNDSYQLPRHRVRGGDSLGVFRMKTSSWFERLSRARRLTAGWTVAPR